MKAERAATCPSKTEVTCQGMSPESPTPGQYADSSCTESLPHFILRYNMYQQPYLEVNKTVRETFLTPTPSSPRLGSFASKLKIALLPAFPPPSPQVKKSACRGDGCAFLNHPPISKVDCFINSHY